MSLMLSQTVWDEDSERLEEDRARKVSEQTRRQIKQPPASEEWERMIRSQENLQKSQGKGRRDGDRRKRKDSLYKI
jgi:hypothetical protein